MNRSAERRAAEVRAGRGRERERRHMREVGVTFVRVVVYAAFITLAFFACGLMIFMVVS